MTAAALEEVAPELPAPSRKRLTELWLWMPAFGDAAATLTALKAAGVRRMVLSNGTHVMIRCALEAAGLGVDKIFSADDVHVYKTNSRLYALLDAEASRGHTMFVSANGWDADGARRDGRTVTWIDRGGEPPATAPNHRVASLLEVVRLVT